MKSVNPIYGKDYAPGYTLFTRKDGNFISDGIVWFQSLQEVAQFSASHVLLVINEKLGIESAEKGVEFCNIQDYFNDTSMEVVCREPKALDAFAIYQMLTKAFEMEKNEVPYDYTAYLGFIPSLFFRFTNWIKILRKLPIPFHWPGAVVCSGFVSACYKATDKYKNIPLFREWHITRITPNMLFNRFPYKEFKLND